MKISFLVLFLGFLACKSTSVAGDQNQHDRRNFITWKDCNMESDSGMLVITVAKNGSGNSTSLQGAIDMVQENNAQRVKIFILPGIY
ncbi:hypothetical protein MKW92_006033, partial [Papaver armeniacum]